MIEILDLSISLAILVPPENQKFLFVMITFRNFVTSSNSRTLVWKRRVFSLLLTSVILASTLFLFSPHLKASTLVAHSQILINGDSKFTATNGVTGGTGTASDPYLIQGWNIIVCWQCPYYGIEVANTTAYFRISNMTVSSQITAQPATDILLKNVTNGRIDNTIVQDGGLRCCGGIIVDSSTNIVVSENNVEAGTCNNFSSCSTYDTVGAYSSTNVTISGNSIQADASGNV